MKKLPIIPIDANPFLATADNVVKAKVHIIEGDSPKSAIELSKVDEILPKGTAEKGEPVIFIKADQPKKGINLEYKGTAWLFTDLSDKPNVIAVSNNVVRDKASGLGLHGLFAVNATNIGSEKPAVPFIGLLAHWNKKIGDKSSFNINPGVLFDPNNDMELSKFRFLGNLTEGKLTFRTVVDLNKDGSFSNIGVHGIYNLIAKSNEAWDISIGVNSGNNVQVPGARVQAGVQFRF